MSQSEALGGPPPPPTRRYSRHLLCMPGTTPSGKAEGAVAEEAMATRRARRGPGQWTSFHIFCEQLRGPLRESFPLITTA